MYVYTTFYFSIHSLIDSGGRWEGVQDGEHMYTHGWLMSVYGKNHYSIVISLQKKKKKILGYFYLLAIVNNAAMNMKLVLLCELFHVL